MNQVLAGNETKRVLLVLGAACLIVALATGTAVIWADLGRSGQVALMVGVTCALLGGAARLRGLPATADALAAVGLAGAAIDAAAARTLGLSIATGSATHVYLAGAASVVGALAVGMAMLRKELYSPRVVASVAPYVLVVASIDPTTTSRAACLGPLAIAMAALAHRSLRRPADLPAQTVSACVAAMVALLGALNAVWAAFEHEPAALWGVLLLGLLLLLPDVADAPAIEDLTTAAASGLAVVMSVAAGSHASALSRVVATMAVSVVVVVATSLSLSGLLLRVRTAVIVSGGAVACVAYASLLSDERAFAVVNTGMAAIAICAAILLPIRWIALPAAGVFASLAADLALHVHGVQTPEAYVVVPSLAWLLCGAVAMDRDRSMPSLVLLPGLAAAVLPTLALALEGDVTRQIAMLFMTGSLVALGAQLRWATPIAVGAGALALVLLRILGPQMVHAPRWVSLAILGSSLLALGATWEARLADAQRLSAKIRPRIAALR